MAFQYSIHFQAKNGLNSPQIMFSATQYILILYILESWGSLGAILGLEE